MKTRSRLQGKEFLEEQKMIEAAKRRYFKAGGEVTTLPNAPSFLFSIMKWTAIPCQQARKYIPGSD